MLVGGDGNAVLRYLQQNYQETLGSLGMEVSLPEKGFQRSELRVHAKSRVFNSFMEQCGYCNRDRFDLYESHDVLAFVVMAEHKLLDWASNGELQEEMRNG